MISEDDEDIKFDECGILKVVTHSKSTFVVVCFDEKIFLNKYIVFLFSSQLVIIFIHLHLKHLQIYSKMIVFIVVLDGDLS